MNEITLEQGVNALTGSLYRQFDPLPNTPHSYRNMIVFLNAQEYDSIFKCTNSYISKQSWRNLHMI